MSIQRGSKLSHNSAGQEFCEYLYCCSVVENSAEFVHVRIILLFLKFPVFLCIIPLSSSRLQHM